MYLGKFKLILASGSPRRKALLAKAGLDFEVRKKEIDESYPTDMPIDEIAEYLAVKKANAQAEEQTEDEILLTADTIVSFDGKEFGKPSSRADSIQTLLLLSGKSHDVYTGVSLRTQKHSISFTCKSVVHFAEITEEEAGAYYDSCDPSDKAGSYGIQDWIGVSKVEWINGSYTNILGLPMAQTLTALRQLVESH